MFLFLIFPISYGRRFLISSYIFFKKRKFISITKKILIFLLITTLLLSDLNVFFKIISLLAPF